MSLTAMTSRHSSLEVKTASLTSVTIYHRNVPNVRKALERKEMTFCQSCTKPPWFMVEPSDSPISLASSSDNDNPNGDQPILCASTTTFHPSSRPKHQSELTNADHALHIKPTTAPMVIDLTASDNDSNTAPALMSSKCGHALSSPPSTPDFFR